MLAAFGAPHWAGPHTGRDICRSLSYSGHVYLQPLPLCCASQRYGLAEHFFPHLQVQSRANGWGHRGCSRSELCKTISCFERQQVQHCLRTLPVPLCAMPSVETIHVTLSDAEGIVTLAKDYQRKGVAVVAISSNSVKTHPQDGPDQMAADAKQFGMCLLSVRY